MKKNNINILTVTSFIIVVVGLLIAFIDIERYGIKINNDGFVSALFNLSGILLFFTALMYQIKDYSLQVVELKKSVEAQTKSSEALDEQKRLLLEQNSNLLILNMIESYNYYRERNKTQEIVDYLIDYYNRIFALTWKENIQKSVLNKEEINIKYADNIKEILSNTIQKHKCYPDFRNFIQFTYNILYLIDLSKPNLPRNNLTPFFLNQLNPKEVELLYLSNLINSGMPFYGNLHWSYYSTIEIIDAIKTSDNTMTDFKDIDIKVLTNRFQNLKQNE